MQRSIYHTLPVRLAKYLLEQSEMGTKQVISFSQQELADALGIHRESVAALLCEFQRQQWIRIRYREYTILNVAALLALCTV